MGSSRIQPSFCQCTSFKRINIGCGSACQGESPCEYSGCFFGAPYWLAASSETHNEVLGDKFGCPDQLPRGWVANEYSEQPKFDWARRSTAGAGNAGSDLWPQQKPESSQFLNFQHHHSRSCPSSFIRNGPNVVFDAACLWCPLKSQQ